MSIEQSDFRFSVFAEAKTYEDPLIQTGMTFPRLIDEIVVPYHKKEPFFIDGVSVVPKSISKLKILQETDCFRSFFDRLNHDIRNETIQNSEILVDQYPQRIEALLRENTDDVTAQTIKAFDSEIRPKLKKYLPNREELIKAAAFVFFKAIETLA